MISLTHKLNTILLIFLILLLPFPVSADEHYATQDLFELSLDELMNTEVITAGRSIQKISEAPAAMSIVTSEDINQLGATTLAEALQMVVGVHLGNTNSTFPLAGGIRGFHKLPANKIMLLIDGISFSYEMYGVPTFFQIPISLKEIDRIEVMRGPGSSLYGANAMFGVVNVITKKPETTHGTLASGTAGEDDLGLVTMMHGGEFKEKFDYRMTLEWQQRDNRDYIAWASSPEQRYWIVNSSMNYQLNSNSDLSFFGGFAGLDKQDVVVESGGPIDQSNSDTIQTVLAYQAKDPKISVKGYYKHSAEGEGSSFGIKYLGFEMGTTGIEFQHELEPFAKDRLVWGANFDQKFSEGDSIDGKHTHDLPGIFLENSYHFTKSVCLNLGGRLDNHPNTDATLSHRLSLLYNPFDGHHFRLTWGGSYRNPDFIESYYSRISPVAKDTYIHVFGSDDLDPEKADTYELGYIGQVTDNCIFNANFFYTELQDFIFFIPSGDPYYDENLGGIVIPYPFLNIGDAEQYGVELEVKYQFTEWLNGVVNYTYLDQKEKDDQVEQLLTMTPQNTVNGQLRAIFKNGFSANATVHYKDVTEWRTYTWLSPDGNTMAGGRADSYTYATLRLGYKFKLAAYDSEVGVKAFNIFDTGFDDYPLDTSDVARRVSCSFSIQF
jgi:iron complex outermembrane receptor protein